MITESRADIDESEVQVSYDPNLKATFGADSLDDRDDVSDVTDAANKYY